MKTIDRYIYSSLILPSLFGISIFTFIMMLNVVMEIMERIFASDLPTINSGLCVLCNARSTCSDDTDGSVFGSDASLRRTF